MTDPKWLTESDRIAKTMERTCRVAYASPHKMILISDHILKLNALIREMAEALDKISNDCKSAVTMAIAADRALARFQEGP